LSAIIDAGSRSENHGFEPAGAQFATHISEGEEWDERDKQDDRSAEQAGEAAAADRRQAFG